MRCKYVHDKFMHDEDIHDEFIDDKYMQNEYIHDQYIHDDYIILVYIACPVLVSNTGLNTPLNLLITACCVMWTLSNKSIKIPQPRMQILARAYCAYMLTDSQSETDKLVYQSLFLMFHSNRD